MLTLNLDNIMGTPAGVTKEVSLKQTTYLLNVFMNATQYLYHVNIFIYT